MFISLKIGFIFVRAAVACAIRERISGFEPSSEACNGTKPLPFHFDLPLDAICAVYHQFGFLSTDLHLIPCAGFVETFNYTERNH